MLWSVSFAFCIGEWCLLCGVVFAVASGVVSGECSGVVCGVTNAYLAYDAFFLLSGPC